LKVLVDAYLELFKDKNICEFVNVLICV